MNNAKFLYLYRDGSNYKNWGEVVFPNSNDLPAEQITAQLRRSFLVDGLFIAHQVRIPEVFLSGEYPYTEEDHCFHEFAEVQSTADATNDVHRRSIDEFITEVVSEAQRGWRAFDPRDRLSGLGR
jgi:hypothetical protein